LLFNPYQEKTLLSGCVSSFRSVLLPLKFLSPQKEGTRPSCLSTEGLVLRHVLCFTFTPSVSFIPFLTNCLGCNLPLSSGWSKKGSRLRSTIDLVFRLSVLLVFLTKAVWGFCPVRQSRFIDLLSCGAHFLVPISSLFIIVRKDASRLVFNPQLNADPCGRSAILSSWFSLLGRQAFLCSSAASAFYYLPPEKGTCHLSLTTLRAGRTGSHGGMLPMELGNPPDKLVRTGSSARSKARSASLDCSPVFPILPPPFPCGQRYTFVMFQASERRP